MAMPYRGLELAADRRFEADAALDADGALVARGRRVYEGRCARTAAGMAGLAVGVVMFADAARLLIVSGRLDPANTAELTFLLWGGWALAAVTYGVARLAAHARLRGMLAPVLRSGDAAADLARLAGAAPRVVLARISWALERWSVAFPMMALSLLAPLTLHLLVAGTFRPALWLAEEDAFGTWIAISVAIVGHAHLALAACCWRFARRARSLASVELMNRGNKDWGTALGVALACSAVPGIVLIALPPLITLVTGLAFIPAMYLVMRRRLINERLTLEAIAG
jgi:hypothetical protein